MSAALRSYGLGNGAAARPAALPEALSATHLHLLTVATRLAEMNSAPDDTLRLLDVGCGDARLLAFLSTALPLTLPDRKIELYGFDIAGHGTQPLDFFSEALDRIALADPATHWQERLHLIAETDPWPFADGCFDIVLSNQVLEHVRDADHFFAELARVLRPGGGSVHLYPSAHVILEPHLGTPFAHWLRSDVVLRRWLALWARFGRSAYGRWAASQSPDQADVDRYAGVHVGFLRNLTHYRTLPQMGAVARRAGLRVSFADSPGYVTSFLRRRSGRGGTLAAMPTQSVALAQVLRYLTSVTLTATKDTPNGLLGERGHT